MQRIFDAMRHQDVEAAVRVDAMDVWLPRPARFEVADDRVGTRCPNA
ncbi:MAG: hypothetical protein ACRDLQ_02490 [Solirubrobacterales bacterium]